MPACSTTTTTKTREEEAQWVQKQKKIENPDLSKGKAVALQAGRLIGASGKEWRGPAEALPKKVVL